MRPFFDRCWYLISSATIALFYLSFFAIQFRNQCCYFTDAVRTFPSQKKSQYLSMIAHHFAIKLPGAIIPISEQSMRKTIEWEFIQLIVNANLNIEIQVKCPLI